MPIYEYGCMDCGETLEVIQKISDPSPTVCAKCGGTLKKLVSNTSFVLKGSGWYSDGYASPKEKAAPAEGAKADAAPAANAEAKKEKATA